MRQKVEKRIMVVEDDLLTAEVIVECLTKAGYLVKRTDSAEEALQSLEDWEPHLVLTDHDMPGMTGAEMLTRLRLEKNYVTVMFLSGRVDEKTIVGSLSAGADDYIKKPFSMKELVARVKVCLRNNDIRRELEQKNLILQEMVDIDDLTGLYNMRSIYKRIDEELSRSQRREENTALIMMDMDNFKNVNDNNDHLFGSFVLQEVGSIIMNNLRAYDFAARFGGDEFLVCLSGTNHNGAVAFCERLRQVIENYEFRDGSSFIRLTCSLGLAITDGKEKMDARSLVRKADHALYESKNNGRNQVTVTDLSKEKVGAS
ncbi:MAG: diguanylate cyclase [Bdellovibrionales bacterium]